MTKLLRTKFFTFLSFVFFFAGSTALQASGDDMGFTLKCPDDVYIDCNDQIDDLDAYGIAYITHDYHTYPAPDPEVHYHVEECGGGFIKRKWQVTGPNGGWYKCTQIIHISGGGTFNEHDIEWPKDYEIHGCFENTDPEDLPHGFDRPKINEEECSEVFMSYKDWVFERLDGGSCGKILRKWKVIDWCVYDPNDHYPKGIWTHTQVIKIKGSSNFFLECPSELTFTAGANCEAKVDLPEATVSGDCPEGVVIKNDSPFADEDGADASGTYPVGSYMVCYTATDGCGYEDECCSWITVKDEKKPTPVCYSGIVITLGLQYDGYYRVCGPDVLNKGSYDNCSAEEDLKLWIEPDTFTCADLGENEVILYVEDESGNVNFCVTSIIVQDNMGMCPPADSLTINGSVHTVAGKTVESTLIQNMSNADETMTNEDGLFSVSNLLADESYMLLPKKEGDAREALDMADLVVMSEYLFGDNEMPDPYTTLAADIDHNQDVNLQDFLYLRGLIIGTYDDFSEFSDQKVWQFVDDNYHFADPSEPWNYRTEKYFNQLGTSQHNENFVAVKTGDLNHSYKVSGFTEAEANVTFRSTRALELQDQALAKGETVDLKIPLLEDDLEGLDLTLNHTTAIDILECQVSDQGVAFHSDDLEESLRILAVKWKEAGESHMTVRLRANESMLLSEALSLANGEAQNRNGDKVDLELRFRRDGEIRLAKEITLSPNPFSEEATVSFNLPKAESYTLEVYNSKGTRLYSVEAAGVNGRNTALLERTDLGESGLYWIHISQGELQYVQKVLLID